MRLLCPLKNHTCIVVSRILCVSYFLTLSTIPFKLAVFHVDAPFWHFHQLVVPIAVHINIQTSFRPPHCAPLSWDFNPYSFPSLLECPPRHFNEIGEFDVPCVCVDRRCRDGAPHDAGQWVGEGDEQEDGCVAAGGSRTRGDEPDFQTKLPQGLSVEEEGIIIMDGRRCNESRSQWQKLMMIHNNNNLGCFVS